MISAAEAAVGGNVARLRFNCPLCNKLLKKARKRDLPGHRRQPISTVVCKPLTPARHQPLLPDTVLSIYCLKGDPADIDIDMEGFIGGKMMVPSGTASIDPRNLQALR